MWYMIAFLVQLFYRNLSHQCQCLKIFKIIYDNCPIEVPHCLFSVSAVVYLACFLCILSSLPAFIFLHGVLLYSLTYYFSCKLCTTYRFCNSHCYLYFYCHSCIQLDIFLVAYFSFHNLFPIIYFLLSFLLCL